MQKGQLVKQISPHVYSANLHVPLPPPGWRLSAIPPRGYVGQLRSMNPVRLRLYSCLYFAANHNEPQRATTNTAHNEPQPPYTRHNMTRQGQHQQRNKSPIPGNVGGWNRAQRKPRAIDPGRLVYLFCFSNSDNTTKGKIKMQRITNNDLYPLIIEIENALFRLFLCIVRLYPADPFSMRLCLCGYL